MKTADPSHPRDRPTKHADTSQRSTKNPKTDRSSNNSETPHYLKIKSPYKSENRHPGNRTPISSDTFFLKIQPLPTPKHLRINLGSRITNCSDFITWGADTYTEISPLGTHCPKLRKGKAGHTGTQTVTDLRPGAQNPLRENISLASPPKTQRPQGTQTAAVMPHLATHIPKWPDTSLLRQGHQTS